MTARNLFSLLLIVSLFCIVSLLDFSSSRLFAQENQESSGGIRTKLRQGWQRLKIIDEANRQYSVKEKSTAHAPTHVRKDERTVEVCASPEHTLGNFNYQDRQENLIVARNPSYAFYIKKKQNEPDWKLGLFGEGQDVKNNSTLAQAFGSLNIFIYYPLSAVAGRMPEDWLNDTGITITKTTRDNRGRYLVSYTSRGVGLPHAKPNQPYQLESVMTVDPNMNWIVLKIDQHGVGLNADYDMQREVIQEGPHLICRRVREKEMYVIPVERLWEFDKYQFDVKFDREIFYLSHYKLPEPIGIKPPERPQTWLWLIVATIAAAALAILFSWLKRRHEMKTRTNVSPPTDRSLS